MPLRFDKDAFLAGIPQEDIRRLMARIEWLWANRRLVKHSPLSGQLRGLYKRRLGMYRIIYSYDPNPDELVIRLVGTRDEIYRKAVD
jgi:mRNA-degrading endonuclease RelE of RelBE toxin-antitoxin system